MTAAWTEVEHLPTRKRLVWFDGTNGADIAALVDDEERCRWDGYELIVKNSQGWFRAYPGNPIMAEADGGDLYTPPADVARTQYRVVGE